MDIPVADRWVKAVIQGLFFMWLNHIAMAAD